MQTLVAILAVLVPAALSLTDHPADQAEDLETKGHPLNSNYGFSLEQKPSSDWVRQDLEKVLAANHITPEKIKFASFNKLSKTVFGYRHDKMEVRLHSGVECDLNGYRWITGWVRIKCKNAAGRVIRDHEYSGEELREMTVRLDLRKLGGRLYVGDMHHIAHIPDQPK